MPPKKGRKRSRESTGTSGRTAKTAAASSAPGSAPPAARRARSNSATSATSSQDDGGGGGGESDPHVAKRSRRGVPSGLETDSDVDMGEAERPAANGQAAEAEAAGGGGATKKGSRRKSAGAAPANGEVRGQVWGGALFRVCGVL